jgi:hypothetical protein
MNRTRLLPFLTLLLIAASPREETSRMLRDPLLVGRDFRTVVASLPAFDAAGEKEISVLPRRVVGETRYRDEERARRAAAAARKEPSPIGIDVILFPDDRTIRVGSEDREAEYVAPETTIDAIERKYGPAERVTTEQLLDGTMRRPIELTLYRFAGGAIVVATSNLQESPRQVDRIMIDVGAARRALRGGGE